MFGFQSVVVSHQTVQLGHGTLASLLADVPHLDAALSSCVDVTSGGADCDGAHYLSVAQCVDLTGMTWDPRAQEGIRGERHRLHLAVCADMKGVGSGKMNRKRKTENTIL